MRAVFDRQTHTQCYQRRFVSLAALSQLLIPRHYTHKVSIMRQILQIGSRQAKAHFLHLKEFPTTCRHAVLQPQRPYTTSLHASRNVCGSLLRRNKCIHSLTSCYKSLRSISKSSEPENPKELSLENVKVQEYLRELRERHLAAPDRHVEAGVVVGGRPTSLVRLLDQVDGLHSDIEELSALSENNEGDEEMHNLATEELREVRKKLVDLQEEVFSALIPEEVMDGRNVVVEVSAGVGGQEAMLFCQEVFNMYLSYAQHRGWQEEITDYNTTDIGGLRHGSLVLGGDTVYSSLKYEGGIHRVQRVPKTEKAGRVHTSTVSVAVLPQPTEIDVKLPAKDLKIETKRASGAGGQHVNTTDSAVRILHIPSGICVESQCERSQLINKEACMKKLRALLYQQQLEHNTQNYNTSRRLQIGGRGRSEKIRTYNFPQDRVTDHRLGITVHNLPSFMSGTEAFHDLVCQLVEEGQRETLQEMIFGMKT